MTRRLTPLAVLLLALQTGCFPGAFRTPTPVVPVAVSGPLTIRVVYPLPRDRFSTGDTVFLTAGPENAIASRDSSFLLGSVGRGDARLTVNGFDVPVYRTGGWLAWIPLPSDSIARFDLVATAGTDTVRAVFTVPVTRGYVPPVAPVWIDTTSLAPRGARWVMPGEGIRLKVRASAGSVVRLVLPDGSGVPFVVENAPDDVPWGQRAFGTAASPTSFLVPPSGAAGGDVGAGNRGAAYVAWWGQGPLGPDPGPVLAPLRPRPDSGWAILEAVNGVDTVRIPWRLSVTVLDPSRPLIVRVNDDTAGTGLTDGALAGRPAPGGTYYWFFPNGTVAAVSGRWNEQVRLQLSRGSAAWVDPIDVHAQEPGTPPPGGIVGSVRLTPGEKSATLRVPLSARVPFRVDESSHSLALKLYGVAADMDWMQHGSADRVVRSLSFAQPAEDETVISLDLTNPVFGYRARWDGNDLLLEVRAPPEVDGRAPLRGRRIAIDPGHPPLGATGPTGARESDVVLAVAQKVQRLLEERGALPLLLRTSDSAVGLAERTNAAERLDAEALVSIHANALPDGVNPLVNNGTSVYYFHPRAAALARELDRALVRHLGFRDLGIGRGDLHMARPTWMPAALTEGLFMMIPEQEAVLASDEGQWRYARGVVEGLEAYFRRWGAEQGVGSRE